MKRIALALLTLTALSGAAFAQKGDKPAAPQALPATAKCPVMGDDFKPTAKSLKSTYKGKTYYFCCGGCKPSFDKDPAKYVKEKPAAKPASKPGKKNP